MRSRTVSFTADNLKPNTIHYAFFDGINVDEHVRPSSNDYSDMLVQHQELITNQMQMVKLRVISYN